MLANKHEAIFDRNLKQIKDMLAGSEGARPYALYLGNWMTDMSQLYDPSVANLFLKSISGGLDFFKPLLTAFDDALDSLKALDRKVLECLEKPAKGSVELGATVKIILIPPDLLKPERSLREVHKAVREMVTELGRERKVLHETFRTLKNLNFNPDAVEEVMDLLYMLVMAMCLFKFGVDSLDEDHAIPPGEVLELFEEHFGTYKPYQHLDRHLSLALAAGKSAKDIEKNYACYAAYEAARAEPYGMKDYLRGGVEIAARFLNMLSLAETSALTNSDLVKLGHSLHAIEDFFAHSNFIERLVATGAGGDQKWLAGLALPELEKLAVSNIALTALPCPERESAAFDFVRRSEGYPWEPHLVTGIFTSADARHSIFNFIADKLLSIFNDQLKDGEALGIFEMFEQVLVNEPMKQLESLERVADKTAQVGKAHRIFVDDGDIRRLLRRKFPDAPPEAVETLRKVANAVIGVMIAISIGKDVYEAAKTIRNIIGLVRTIIKIVTIVLSAQRALVYLVRSMKPILRWLCDQLLDEDAAQLLATLTDSFLSDLKKEMLTAPTIGSHSAIAKDDRLSQNGFYQKAEDLAVAADGLVLRNLLRKSPTGAAGAEAISWDETLLSLFTDPMKVYSGRNPVFGGSPGVTRVPVPAEGLNQTIRRGYALSGKLWTDYVVDVLCLNPNVAPRDRSFVYRRGPRLQDVRLPLELKPKGRGWRAAATGLPGPDWRREIYFDGEPEIREDLMEMLDDQLIRRPRGEVQVAVALARKVGETTLGEFQTITKTLFPAAFPGGDIDKVIWGYTGF